jgi:hypothetical protein
MMSPNRLARWVRDVYKKTDQFQLYFLSGDDSSEILQTWDVSEVRETEAGTIAWCEQVLALCQDDCDNEREIDSRYRLIAIKGGAEIGGRVSKHKPSGDRVDPLGINGNAGNNANDQLRRMNEAFLRIHVQSLAGIFEGYKTLLATQAKEITLLREQQREMSEAVQAAAIKSLDLSEDDQRSSVALTKLAGVLEKVAPEFMTSFAAHVANGGIPEV